MDTDPRNAIPVSPSNSGGHAAARTWLERGQSGILEEQIELARIPAPPFQERARSDRLAAKLTEIGLAHGYDDVGNLLAWLPSESAASAPAPVVIAAHVDTVFGPEVPIEIRPDGRRWVGPGITDNARGLAVTLAVLRALVRHQVEPRRPLLFAFTVGEEGRGDLRGVKHLFREGSQLRSAAAFLAVDGSGLRRITHRGLGSRRFRLVIRGPGGHSWTNWDRVNPANAAGELISELKRLRFPDGPRTTLTVARLGGGTSINAIPAEAWVELDLRSEVTEVLEKLDADVRRSLARCVAAENLNGTGDLHAEVELIGQRPAGALPLTHPLVGAARQATFALGIKPEFTVSSTDANVPLALGIPAIAIGGGGASGDTHTRNEWFEDTNGANGPLRLLSTLAAIADF